MANTIYNLEKAIRAELLREIKVEVDNIVKESQQEIEKRIRERIAQSVMSLNRWYSLERMGDIIRIEVKIDGQIND